MIRLSFSGSLSFFTSCFLAGDLFATLTYADIHDHDKASNINVGVSVSGSYNGGTEGPKLAEEQGAYDASLGSVSVDYSSRDRRQINRATIGEGTIIIRSDPNAGLEGLNRDLARAQEITRDSETAVSVFIDPAVIKEIASGFEGIAEGFKSAGEEIQQLAREYKTFTAALPPDMRHMGDAGLTAMQNMIRGGANDDVLAIMRDEKFQGILSNLADINKHIADGKSLTQNVTSTKSTRLPDGSLCVEVHGAGESLGNKVVNTLNAAKEYFDSIPYKEEASLALLGLQIVIMGPIKTTMSLVEGAVVDSAIGSKV